MLYALDLYEDLTVAKTGPASAASEDSTTQVGALAELSEVYRKWGFDAGYAQATRDHLEMFVANAESVLGERAGTLGGSWAERDAARRLLYNFIARLERRMGHFARDYSQNDSGENGRAADRPLVTENFEVAGGLGI